MIITTSARTRVSRRPLPAPRLHAATPASAPRSRHARVRNQPLAGPGDEAACWCSRVRCRPFPRRAAAGSRRWCCCCRCRSGGRRDEPGRWRACAEQVLQDQFLDLLAGPAQARTQQFNEPHREIRLLLAQEGQKVAAVDDKRDSQSVLAMASVERACPSSIAISPKVSPAPIRLSSAARPSDDDELIRTVPRATANMLAPGSPLETTLAPRLYLTVLA